MNRQPRSAYWLWYDGGFRRGRAGVLKIDGISASSDVDIRLLRGERFERAPKLTIVDFTRGSFGDRVPCYVEIAIVSGVLRDVLEHEASTSLQFLPVNVRGHRDLKYWVVNVLSHPDAVDQKRSDISTDADGLWVIRKVVLKPLGDDVPSIFMPKDLQPLVLVSDGLRQKLQAASTSAGEFTPLDKIRLLPDG